jgi:PAS domain S-box-containing protein
MFERFRFEEDSFDARLVSLLDDARAQLALDWIGVAEIGSPDGHAKPVWRAISGDAAVPETFSSEHRPHEACAIALSVDPPFGAIPGAWLVFASARLPSAQHLSELRALLQQALSRDRRQRLGAIALEAFRRAVDPLELTDREARLLLVNDAWERIFGYTRAAALGRTVGELFRDPDQPQHDPSFYRFSLQSIQTDGAWLGMITSRAENGDYVHCEVAVAPFEADPFGSDGPRVLGNFAIRRDLRFRRDREIALANAHREFRAVLASLPDAVAVVRSQRLYFVNAAFLAIVGRTEEQVIGRPVHDFVHPDDRAAFEAAPPGHVTPIRALRHETIRLVDIASAGSISFEGEPATIFIGRDRTDQRLAEEQLARAEKLSALGALAAGVAHELNNPLAYVILNLEVLAARDESPVVKEALEGAIRMKRIADELRVFSRRDGPSESGPTDVEQAVTSALNLTQNLIRHRARLVREHAPGLSAAIGEGALVQALVNLLTNAAEAIPSDGGGEHTITVSSRAVADGIEIAVADTGTGIDADHVEHLFDPFLTTKPVGQGTGLGLAITRRIVEQQGGRIRVDTSPGRGTSFVVTLRSAAPRLESVHGPGPATAEGLRVLIVDDDVAVARALRRILGGHRVEHIGDGRAACKRLVAEEDVDVVLCDLMMPGVSGLDVHREVVTQRPELGDRFLFMTGGTFTGPEIDFVARNPEIVLHKPFEATVLRARIAAMGRRAG